jgi:hypothetical protein
MLYPIQTELSLYPEYFAQEVVSNSPLSRISTGISSDYKKIFKSPIMVTAWARNMGFAPTHSEKRGPLPK